MQKKKKKGKEGVTWRFREGFEFAGMFFLEGGIQRGVKEVRHSEGLFSGRRAEEKNAVSDFLWNSVIKQF